MSEAAFRRLRHGPTLGWASVLAAVVAGVALVAVAVVVAPYAFDPRLVDGEVATQLRETTGLTLTTRSRMRFDLLPSPHIVAHGLDVSDPSRTLSITAEELRGDVRLLPLLVGRVELTGATLVRPHLTIDPGGQPMRPDSMIGRALRNASARTTSAQRLGSVTFVDGTLTVHGRRGLDLTGVDLTIDWPDLDSPATLTGSVERDKISADVALWIAQPSSLMRGEHSPLTLNVRSAPLALSANGDLANADTTSFRGHLSVTAPSGADLVALAGARMPAPAHFGNLSLTSDIAATVDRERQGAIDLPNLRLRADENDYEGTLSVQIGGAKPLVSGTLASDQLSLAPFLRRLPPLLDAARAWSRAPILPVADQPVDLDLRISANHLRISAFTVDDAALGVITRQDRTEVGLIDGKAYGGAVKGRVSFGLDDRGLSLRGAGSFSDVDLATLSWDAFGRQIATGRLSGSATLETAGSSPAALAKGLGGWLKISASDGELATVDLRQTLDGRGPQSLREGRTPFARLASDIRISDGVATISDGRLSGSDGLPTLVFGGTADLGARRLALHVETANPQAGGTRPALEVRGGFDHPTIDVAAVGKP